MDDRKLKVLIGGGMIVCALVLGLIGWLTAFIYSNQWVTAFILGFCGLYVPWIILWIFKPDYIIQHVDNNQAK